MANFIKTILTDTSEKFIKIYNNILVPNYKIVCIYLIFSFPRCVEKEKSFLLDKKN